MKKFLSEFKAFALRGNIFELAIGVVIGGAFNKIVSSLVTDIIMPIIGFLTGGINFTDFKITLVEAIGDKAAVTLNIGLFMQNVVDFLIIALSIFITIKIITKVERRVKTEENTEETKVPDDILILREIRDLLKIKEEKVLEGSVNEADTLIDDGQEKELVTE